MIMQQAGKDRGKNKHYGKNKDRGFASMIIHCKHSRKEDEEVNPEQ